MDREPGDSRLDETRSFKMLSPGTLISRYKIIEKIGEGGMGVVYKALDTRLDRTVALKFLPASLDCDDEAKTRFEHEAKAASALNHPNIATIHEIDEAEGRCFISMEYLEGGSLKEVLKDREPSIKEILDLALQIGEGLNAAHESGVVHRDLKPDNIMLTKRGMAKITDFGLAKLRGQAKLTKTGTALGTVAYMSPEQARGEAVDHRTDIWSLGVVLYEMLTGGPPFRGDYDQAVIHSILNEAPGALTSFRQDTPNQLEQVVNRALEKDADHRYQDIRELLQDLRTAPISSSTSRQDQRSIVVLPFDDISPGRDNEYFSDGLTEEIITDLSKVHALRVISRTSAMRLKGTEKDVNRIGRELNVRYVLEGSVRKAGNHLRITAQLIDATADSHIWAEKYSGTLDDVFDIQEKVSRSIVEALKLKLSPEEQKKIGQRPIDNVQAYECYLRARQEIWRWTEGALDRAIRYLDDSLDIVGENALIYAGMGYVYWQYVNIGFRQDEYVDKAEEYANKVFALDPESSQGHCLLGILYSALRGDQRKAVHHLKQALAINPNDPDTLFWLGNVYPLLGKTHAAIPLIQRLLQVDPLTPANHGLVGWVHLLDGRFSLAVEAYRKRYRVEPNSLHRMYYGYALAYDSCLNEAFSLIEPALRSTPADFYGRLLLFLLYGLQGKKVEALRYVTEDLKKTARRDLEYSWEVAVCYAVIGDNESALDWLENAVNHGFMNYPFLNRYDRFLENLRHEARFKQLMEIVKHEWEHFEV